MPRQLGSVPSPWQGRPASHPAALAHLNAPGLSPAACGRSSASSRCSARSAATVGAASHPGGSASGASRAREPGAEASSTAWRVVRSSGVGGCRRRRCIALAASPRWKAPLRGDGQARECWWVWGFGTPTRSASARLPGSSDRIQRSQSAAGQCGKHMPKPGELHQQRNCCVSAASWRRRGGHNARAASSARQQAGLGGAYTIQRVALLSSAAASPGHQALPLPALGVVGQVAQQAQRARRVGAGQVQRRAAQRFGFGGGLGSGAVCEGLCCMCRIWEPVGCKRLATRVCGSAQESWSCRRFGKHGSLGVRDGLAIIAALPQGAHSPCRACPQACHHGSWDQNAAKGLHLP